MEKILSITTKCLIVLILSTQLISCTNKQLEVKELEAKSQQVKDDTKLDAEPQNQTIIVEEGEVIQSRILPPKDFHRNPVKEGSFGEYLRNLPLKPHTSPVMYFNGAVKNKNNVYMAVVDMDIGDRDLQQCADAIMRLRGEYLYGKGDYNAIHFNFTNGFRVDYNKWMAGYRIVVNGNKTSWQKKTQPSNTYEDFRRYMNIVFAYAGTISLEQELTPVLFEEMEIGDVLIQGGSPGHAVIVVDMAVNEDTGEKLYLLAQSYMPAQETQILVNTKDADLSPWFSLNLEGDVIVTPEWTFKIGDLKRFP